MKLIQVDSFIHHFLILTNFRCFNALCRSFESYFVIIMNESIIIIFCMPFILYVYNDLHFMESSLSILILRNLIKIWCVYIDLNSQDNAFN